MVMGWLGQPKGCPRFVVQSAHLTLDWLAGDLEDWIPKTEVGSLPWRMTKHPQPEQKWHFLFAQRRFGRHLAQEWARPVDQTVRNRLRFG